MGSVEILAVVLVLPGALFLLAAAFLGLRLRREVPEPLQPRWWAITWLIFFFVAGYLLFLGIQAWRLPLPPELVSGVIFLVGGQFVFLVMTVSRQTIRQALASNREALRVNQQLIAKNRELTSQVQARQQAEERARLRLQHLATLHAIDLVITASLDLKVTMKLFLDQVVPQLDMDAGAILLLDPQLQELEYAAGVGFRTSAIEHSWERLGEGTAGMVAKERQILVHPSFASCPSMERRGLTSKEEGFVVYCAAPLISQGQVRGVLEVFRRSPFEPDREWLDFFDALAVQAAIAIDNATMFKKLQDSNAELILAYDTTIEGWAKALELRDRETEGHTQRVTEMTVRMARALGIRDEELAHVRRGALLHDIGKMAVPDAVLLKEGPLTPEEQKLMRRHPQYAFELLSPIAYLRPALDIPYCHHEWWDGSGYPRGLKGKQIPLAARIFALVDTWDALVSKRRYHEAWSPAKAEAQIRSLAGRQFEPALVEKFLRLLHEQQEEDGREKTDQPSVSPSATRI